MIEQKDSVGGGKRQNGYLKCGHDDDSTLIPSNINIEMVDNTSKHNDNLQIKHDIKRKSNRHTLQTVFLMLLFVVIRLGSSISIRKAFLYEKPNIFLLLTLMNTAAFIIGLFWLYVIDKSSLKAAYTGEYGKQRMILYAKGGIIGSISQILLQISYKWLDITTVLIISILQYPTTMLFQYIMLKRYQKKTVILSTLLFTLLIVLFILFDSDHSHMSDNTYYIGIICMLLYSIISGGSNVYFERGFTADRPISELLTYNGLFGFTVTGISYAIISYFIPNIFSYNSGIGSTDILWTMLSFLFLTLSQIIFIVFVYIIEDILIYASSKGLLIISTAIAQSFIFDQVFTIYDWFISVAVLLSFFETNFVASVQFKEYSIIYPICKQTNTLVLGKNKRGLFKGYINGFGGKISPNENCYISAYRELYEECNLNLKKGMILRNIYYSAPSVCLNFSVDITKEQLDEIKETEEMEIICMNIDDFEKEYQKNINNEYDLLKGNIDGLRGILKIYQNKSNDIRLSAIDTKIDSRFVPIAYRSLLFAQSNATSIVVLNDENY